LIKGSVADGLARVEPGDSLRLSVEHPTGEFTVDLHRRQGELAGCGLLRTARLLFEGMVCIPASVWSGKA
jgi:4-oxalomesaconate tautomerase